MIDCQASIFIYTVQSDIFLDSSTLGQFISVLFLLKNEEWLLLAMVCVCVCDGWIISVQCSNSKKAFLFNDEKT